MQVNITMIAAVMNQMQQDGRIPAEIHMNRPTLKAFRSALKCAGWKTPFFWQRDVLRFHGVPVVANEAVPSEGVLVRPLHLMQSADWMKAMHDEAMAIQAKMNAPVENRVITANDFLAKEPSSPSDVLIQSTMESEEMHVVCVVSQRKDMTVKITGNAAAEELSKMLALAVTRMKQGG